MICYDNISKEKRQKSNITFFINQILRYVPVYYKITDNSWQYFSNLYYCYQNFLIIITICGNFNLLNEVNSLRIISTNSCNHKPSFDPIYLFFSKSTFIQTLFIFPHKYVVSHCSQSVCQPYPFPSHVSCYVCAH